MRFPKLARLNSWPDTKRDILSHWVWAIPVILVVAALALRRVDFYPPTHDEFASMNAAGLVSNQPHTPIDVIQFMAQRDPIHTPFYFILLNIWPRGGLVGSDIATARIMTINIALLALAMIYRLARDTTSPVAGFFAIVLLASSAFYNYYVLIARMYTLLVLTSTVFLWLYWRALQRRKQPKGLYFALFCASLALAYTHVFSAILFLAIGVYHLFFARKNRQWIWTTASISLAVLSFTPWLEPITSNVERNSNKWLLGGENGWDTVSLWLSTMSNGLPLILLVCIIAIVFAWRKSTRNVKPVILVFLIYVLVLGLMSQVLRFFEPNTMRYLLAGLPILTLLVATGIACLYDFRKWLGLLVLIWVLAGIRFSPSPELRQMLSKGHRESYKEPAWHAVSRLAQNTGHQTAILGYRVYVADLTSGIEYSSYHGTSLKGNSQEDYYFTELDIDFIAKNTLSDYFEAARYHSISASSLWTIYHAAQVNSESVAQIDIVMNELDYIFCGADAVGYDTAVRQYRWTQLGCDAPEPLASYQTQSIDYELYVASVKPDARKLYFVDRWTAGPDFDPAGYHLSHQLFDEDWQKIAQLDLPLVHEAKLRRFSIDVSGAPPGKYRLMAILYNVQTGVREPWLGNTGYIPEMQSLREVTLN